MKRWIMHVDMDAFYASIEQRDHEEYKGRPVIVGGLSSRGVVATCSYEARAFGVRSAMSLREAKRRCPQGIYLWPRHDYYSEVSAEIQSIMRRYSPYIEPLSLDEAFLDISGMGHMFKGPLAMGRAIKEEIYETVGLVASVGIGPNKWLAKLASDLKKPNGLVIIPPEKAMSLIQNLPVRRMWGVGTKMEEALKNAGFHRIGDIAALGDERKLTPICGNQSKAIYDMAHGIDHRPVEYNRAIQSIGNELTYEEDISDPEIIDREWRYFAYKVAKRLREHHLKGHTIAIKVRLSNFSTYTRQKRLTEATNREDVLYQVSQVLYNKIGLTGPFRLLGITVSGFDEGPKELSLFDEYDVSSDDVLANTLDEIQAKLGDQAIMKGSLWQRYRDGKEHQTQALQDARPKEGELEEGIPQGGALSEEPLVMDCHQQTEGT